MSEDDLENMSSYSLSSFKRLFIWSTGKRNVSKRKSVEKRFRRAGTFMFEPKQKFENHEKLCAAHVLTEGLDSCILRVMNVSSRASHHLITPLLPVFYAWEFS
jgi:hypothetical protein